MSSSIALVALWSAGLVCAGVGLLQRRAVARAMPAHRPPHAIPRALRLAARAPCPLRLVRQLRRCSDEAGIRRAGLSSHLAPGDLARMRAALALGGLVVGGCGVVAGPLALLASPLMVGIGIAAPGRWVARRERARGRAIARELPDLLDLLGICIESGMALDPALRLAADRLGGALGAEIAGVLRDLSLGAPRRAAYATLVDHVGTPEMARTVGALLQAEELGAPLSRALHGQSEALRAVRRQDARESAARAAPKIQLVVAMVMVPAVLLLVLGVLLIELGRQVGAVVG